MSYFSWARLSDKAHLLTWLSWALLLLVQVTDAWQRELPLIFWLVKVLPLLIFLPGMLKNSLRSYIWVCFVCLMYFLVLVERLFAQPDSVLAITGMVAVVVLFNAAMLFVRWRARELKSE
ncbi:MAG: DUF2069 domain-containing protein [Halioglobus sp.]